MIWFQRNPLHLKLDVTTLKILSFFNLIRIRPVLNLTKPSWRRMPKIIILLLAWMRTTSPPSSNIRRIFLLEQIILRCSQWNKSSARLSECLRTKNKNPLLLCLTRPWLVSNSLSLSHHYMATLMRPTNDPSIQLFILIHIENVWVDCSCYNLTVPSSFILQYWIILGKSWVMTILLRQLISSAATENYIGAFSLMWLI